MLPENVGEVDATWSPDGTQLAFGRVSAMNTGIQDIQLVDVKTRQISMFPGSNGLFSPRWSPDGRYLQPSVSRAHTSSCCTISVSKSGRSGLSNPEM